MIHYINYPKNLLINSSNSATMQTIMENIDNLEILTNWQLQDGIIVLGGKPHKYKNKKDNIKYISELMSNAINISNTIMEYGEANKTKNIKSIQNFVKCVNQQEQKRKIEQLEHKVKFLSNDNARLKSININLAVDLRELELDYNELHAQNTRLLQSKSLCVTNDLTELTELILNKSSTNEIPEGIALELNNKLLEIYKKSKYGSVADYHEQEQVGVVGLDEDNIPLPPLSPPQLIRSNAEDIQHQYQHQHQHQHQHQQEELIQPTDLLILDPL